MTGPIPPLTVELDAALGDLLRGLAEAEVAVKTFARNTDKILDRAGDNDGRNYSHAFLTSLKRNMGSGLSSVGGLLGGLGKLAMPAGITGLIFGAAQAIAAVAPAVGALNLIPAAAGAAVVGLVTLKMAFKGIGTALSAGAAGDLEKYAEALKKLAPAAQDGVRALLSLKPAMDAIRASVQQNFWTDLAADIKALGGTYLPILRQELGGVATALNTAFREIAAWLKVPDTVASITASLENMRVGWVNAAHAFAPFLSGLNDLVEVGSRFLPSLGAGFANLGDRFSAFMAEIAGNGQLEAFIQGGLDALRLLGPLLSDVWGILHPIIAALNATSSGGLGFLGTLLHQLAEFFNSTQGMAALTALFALLAQGFGVIGHAIMLILPLLGKIITAWSGLMTSSGGAAAEVAVLDALAVALDQVITSLLPLLPPLFELAVAALPALIPLFRILAHLLIIQSPLIILIARLLAVLLVPAFQLLAFVLTWVANLMDRFVTPVVAVGNALVDLAFKASTWKVIGAWFVNIWRDITDAFATGLAWIQAFPGKVWAVLKTLPGILGRAAVEALHRFAYAIGYGLGTVVKIWLTLPGLIWNILTNLWNGAWALTVAGINALADFVSKLPDRVGGFFTDLWNTAQAVFTHGVDVTVSTAASMPGRVWDAIKALSGLVINGLADSGSWLYNTGANLIQGLLNGVASMWSRAVNFVRDLAHSMWSGFTDALGIHSESTVFMYGGAQIVAGLVKGIADNAGAAAAAVASLIGGTGLRSPAFGLGGGGGVGVPAGLVGRGGSAREQVIHVVNKVYLDGKELHEGLIRPAQRYKNRNGNTGLS